MKQLKRVSSMRDVIALAADPTVDKVSGFNFRSEEEVQKFLDLLNNGVAVIQDHLKGMTRLFSTAVTAAGFTIDRKTTNTGPASAPTKSLDDALNIGKIEIKNVKKLKDSFALVVDISKKLDMLETLEQTIAHNFRGERGSKLPAEIKKTREAYEKQFETAMKFLKTVAQQHEPKKFKAMVEGVSNYFEESFRNKYDKAESHLFVTSQDLKTPAGERRPHLVFNHYLQFKNLHNDHLEYVFPTYIIVYSAVVNEAGGMRMYVTSQHKFRAPGTFKLGHEFKDLKSGVNALQAQFESDDFIDMLDRQPFPITTDQVNLSKFTAKEFIKSHDISDHRWKFTFNSKVKTDNIGAVMGKLLMDVRSVFSGKIKAGIRSKVLEKTKGAEFIITLPKDTDTSKFLTPEKIDRLKEDLNFDDHDIAKLVQQFNNGHMDNQAPYLRPGEPKVDDDMAEADDTPEEQAPKAKQPSLWGGRAPRPDPPEEKKADDEDEE